jgi:hypothetical protein
MNTQPLVLPVAALLAATLLACGGGTVPAAHGVPPGALVAGAQQPAEAQAAAAEPPAAAAQQQGGKGTPGFVCAAQSGGAARPVPPLAQIRGVRAAHDDGFDRFVLEFDGTGPVPQFEVTPLPSARFTLDPSGREVTLEGSAGVAVVVRQTAPAPNGATELRPELPVVKEARQTGAFEGVVSWGLGVASPACVRILTLEHPTRLVVDLRD